MSRLLCGWAQVSLTPDRPVFLSGQFHARVSEGVRDPVTATVLALRGPDGEHAVLVSCDLVVISDELRDAVRGVLDLPGLDPGRVVFNATHTHTAPECRPSRGDEYGVALDAMPAAEYVAWAAERLAAAVAEAWQALAPSGLSFGLSHAVLGHNRRWTAFDGVSTMYGNTNDPAFSHLEGYEDHSLNVLAVWDAHDRLTGLVVNAACPSQVTEGDWQISADYWHEVRVELRRRLGGSLFVLAQ